MSMDSRECLADMALEMGVKACLVECDEITDAYLKKALKGEPYELVTPDQDASYEAVYDVDVSDMVPMISMPHTPSNAATVKEAEGKKVNQAFLGSCTNGRMEDLKIAADMLRGKTISPKVRLIVTPASNEIYNKAMEKGYLKIFMDAGATITNATCGACVGGHLGLIAAGEVCISSSNRNFRGRMGSKDGEIYLASPAAVIASAITGEITDPRGVS
ncbi:MAG: hypothetical protein CVV34_01045 [Methanomicrobiales archaeon HGW-Methanomicrobiales-5]|nr:MAG: hypothetical protein CVV34_01045 [Methanomicrobiales archaeon HGW-Methanomicrobiales-5]